MYYGYFFFLIFIIFVCGVYIYYIYLCFIHNIIGFKIIILTYCSASTDVIEEEIAAFIDSSLPHLTNPDTRAAITAMLREEWTPSQRRAG